MKNQHIVFVDSAVEDWQSLAVGVKAGKEVILVDRGRDGIEQIAEALQSRKGIESVHIISHGESGSLQLGPTILNSDNLETYRDCLKRWFSSSVNSIKNRFEILLYGCNVAAGEKGEAFVQKLSKLTKANIAASSDITGSAQKGGNWVLEYATGAIKTGLAIEPEVMASYAHTLAIFTVTNTADSGPGSLRDAITQANALAGADIINFNIPAPGVQTIAPLTSLPIITEAVTIDGTSQPGFAGTPLIQLDGTNAGGTTNGILITGSGSTIRGLAINRFQGSGIFILGNTATGNSVLGNYIGTDPNGTADLGNGASGVVVDNAAGNTIGGTAAGDRNIISGNNAFGVLINAAGATGNRVLGNIIGTNAAGTAALPNALTGVQISGGSNNIIGGTTVADRNLISGNGSAGVFIDGATATGNTVLGNFIGTDINGTADLGNVGFGVAIQNAPNNTIGGNTAGARNIISGNNAFGVLIQNTPATSNAATGNTVLGNFIGTDVNGTADLGNTLTGVLIQDAAGNTIGGTAAGDRNIISGNDGFGVQILNANATLNSVLGNYIGTNAAGTAALPNTIGVVVDNAPSNTIGGSVAGAGNIISGNSSPNAGLGVQITGASATGNTLRGNFIGVAANGTSPLGNSSIGVQITAAATNNAIGGTAAGEGNIIANNGNIGVAIASGIGNSIQNNSIFANVGIGIDLGNDGITANDPGDADTGANNLQNTPVLTTATASAGSVTVAGTFNSTPSTPFTLQIFANTSPGTQGQTFIASIPVTTDAAGNAAFNQTFPAAVTAGQLITATATDAVGNTSEFSAQPVPVVVPLSTITGIKFNDIDGNGTQAAGELGVAGVTVFLDTNGDNILSAGETSATTGADGSFTFGNLPAGTYNVREFVPAGSRQTTQNPPPVILTAGQTTPATVNFGNQAIPAVLGSITGIKFNDADGNGTQAAGELGVPGVTIFLDTNNDGILDATETSTTSDANGSFAFPNLASGTYNVREVVPPFSQPTTPNPVPVTLTAGQTTPATVNFGNSLQAGTITGIKFNDTNGNGTQDTGEIGIPGVTIFLDTNNNGTSDTGETQVTTGTDGSYSFPNLQTGTYNVREVVPTGFTPTTPNPRTVPLDPGQTSTANFGNQQVPPTPTPTSPPPPTPTPTPPQPPTPVQQSSISGLKFNDGNGNGTQDAEETRLSGWQIFLDANGNNSLDDGETTVTTDNSGNYSFNNLNPGTYNVREVQQTGWTQTTANPAAVNLGSGESQSNVNFGNFQNISISGSKFNDLNNNGVLDAQEPLLPNWQLFLDANSNDSLDAGEVNTSTDSLGGYSFANLGPGTYRVREVNQPGWTQTTANPADIIAVSGTNVDNINFGNSFAQVQPTPTPTPLPPQEGQDADCICSQIVLPSISSIRSPNSVTNSRNGTNGNDTILGTNNGDEINGFDGDDLLAGLRGNDNIYGGLNSAFPVGPDIDTDLVFGNEGNDYLNGVAGDDLIFAGKNEDVVYGGKDDDIIFGDQESDTLIGDQGNDTIYGGTINPFDPDLTGNDLVFGLAGDDFLSGEKNQDTIAGGDGNDTVRAGKGDDLVVGELGSNLLFGDEGSDTICGGEGEDTVYGDIGSPLPIGSTGGKDQICGGLGNDWLFGNEGQDTVNGDTGNDTLYGGKDEDSLLGSAGDDWLFGDQGNDTLIGGTGNDRFMLGIDLGSETILDFQYGLDSIGLIGGLNFSQLSIVAENNSTLIRVTGSGQLLATLSNVPASVITATDFALL
ncbi:SdrD B-like domain-containing protein [Microcoleus sp. LAD1_D3]|uniref:SdrD B-like domain-containing protein n=1 Tax=Microcoleus sp. LAD1_D3 TaxID=2819365 RepID=UPI002FD556A3